MLQTGEWVVVIVTAAVVTALVVAAGYVFELPWLMSSAWLVGIAVAGVLIYAVRRSDGS